jgi:hypothetical protein
MIKIATLVPLLALFASAASAQPPCMPATLALATGPLGTPVSSHTYWPTVSSAPMEDGLAVFWYCQVSGEIKVVEMHGTPQAIAQAGGLQSLHSRYLSRKDEAMAELEAAGHICVDPDAKPTEVAQRPDCVVLPGKAGQPKRYLCLNPKVSSPQESKLCKHLINEMVAQWPQ